jgi:hypothetical protein
MTPEGYDRRDAVHKKTVAGPGTAPHKSRLLRAAGGD